MKIAATFRDLAYVGSAEGDRKTYHVLGNRAGYLVVAENSPSAYNVNRVPAEAVETVGRRFKGQKVTTGIVVRRSGRPNLFRDRFRALNTLYTLVALGRARKLKQREGRSMLFKVQ